MPTEPLADVGLYSDGEFRALVASALPPVGGTENSLYIVRGLKLYGLFAS